MEDDAWTKDDEVEGVKIAFGFRLRGGSDGVRGFIMCYVLKFTIMEILQS